MCLHPKLIKNKRYVPNKKNGGNVPFAIDERVKSVPIKCNKCIECKRQKTREWSSRLKVDLKHHKNPYMVTLTFSNESIKELSKEMKIDGYERDNAIASLGVRRFLERWRKKYKKSVRHWLVTELGHNGTENIHLHGIIYLENNENIEDISNIWKYGYIRIGNYVNNRTINYIVKYIAKTDVKHKYYESKVLCSNGIGSGYEKTYMAYKNKYIPNKTDETYTDEKGYKSNLPIYWRNKIYTEDEREKLWLEKLDKEERFILGKKINLKKGTEEFKKALKHAQIKNKELGYGGIYDWNEKEYERQMRNIMFNKRTENYEIRKKIEIPIIEYKDLNKIEW